MTFAWLPYPFAGHFKIKRFRNRESALRFVDMTVPYLCKAHVRIVDVFDTITAALAVTVIIIGIVWR